MIWPLKYKWYVKTALACFAALGAFKFQIFRIIGGHYFSPDLPEWVIIAGAWLYGAFYFVPPMLICSEVVRLFKWKNSTHLWNKVNLGIAVAALAASGVGLWCGSLDPVISEHSVEITQLPAAADGLKIAFLTDLHIDHTVKKEKVAGLVKRVNSINADLIALGGDLMDGPVSKCGSSMKELENLKAPLGVFGVLGNHEFYSDAAGWLEFFRNSGIKMLINEKVELPGGVMLAGVGDRWQSVFSGIRRWRNAAAAISTVL
ncbi:MAG: metallophosphoesterase, partial [Lentisphaeria bacterium]|nr:metallophosphoesterase [Lentisphaeria bacterium]